MTPFQYLIKVATLNSTLFCHKQPCQWGGLCSLHALLVINLTICRLPKSQ
jgi:hypothetical protein